MVRRLMFKTIRLKETNQTATVIDQSQINKGNMNNARSEAGNTQYEEH
jgi:hypothetical protein